MIGRAREVRIPVLRVAARSDDHVTVVCVCGCQTHVRVVSRERVFRPGEVISALDLVAPGVMIVRRS